MKHRWAKSVEHSYCNFVAMREAGAEESAFVHLGEILNVLANQRVSQRDRDQWERTITEESSTLSCEHVSRRLTATVEKLRRIVSVPGEFDEDEILLILTLRVSIELASHLLVFLGWNCVPLCDQELDELLHHILKDVSNDASTKWAAGLMRRNWGVPLVSEWL